MKRTSSLILEAGPSLRITNLTNGRVKIELEEVDSSCLEAATPDTVYDKSGLSKRLGVSKRSIDNYIRQPRHPLPYTISMGRARFLETDVIKWLQEGASPAARRAKARLGL
jgi:predicted DNA-binding transcriptional regulator AlpA